MDRLWAMTVFARVAECSSFSRAAESLDLANATVTSCVRNLERHLGVTLIHRDTRRLSLTDEGALFLERAREILAAVEDAESAVQEQAGSLRGPLAIESPIAFGHALLCPAMPVFSARYPGVVCSLTLTNQRHHLIEKAIDVAIRMDMIEDAELVARPFYEAEYLLCCAPSVAAELPASPTQLDPARCLAVLNDERRGPVSWQLAREEERHTIVPCGPLRFNSSDALVNAARAGVGLVNVLDAFIAPAIAAGDLVVPWPDWTSGSRTFYAVTTKARASAARVRAFIDFLTEVMDQSRRPAAARPVEVRPIGRR